MIKSTKPTRTFHGLDGGEFFSPERLTEDIAAILKASIDHEGSIQHEVVRLKVDCRKFAERYDEDSSIPLSFVVSIQAEDWSVEKRYKRVEPDDLNHTELEASFFLVDYDFKNRLAFYELNEVDWKR